MEGFFEYLKLPFAGIKSAHKEMKMGWYLITVGVAVILFIIMAPRAPSTAGSFFLYGFWGHLIILVVSFFFAMELGASNIYLKWLYPFVVALFVHSVIPLFFYTFIFPTTNATSGFLIYYLVFFGFIVFLPHLIVPLIGMGIGVAIYQNKP